MAYSHKSTKERWVEQISMSMTIKPPTIDIVIDSDDANKTLCISTVPESFSCENPEAYKPQKLGLGPYHHFREEVYKMEWDKVATVRSALDEDQINHFHDLVVDKIKPLYVIIHAFYGNFVDMDADTFAWMFAVDGLFLMIQIIYMKKEFVRDIMMLENQIPFLVLKELQSSLDQVFMNQVQGEDDNSFAKKLIKFCEEVSPLELAKESQICAQPSCRLHLLDLLYELIVNNNKQANDELSSRKGKATCIKEIKASVQEKFPSCLCCRQAFRHVRFMICMVFEVLFRLFGKKDEGRLEEEKINAQEIRIPSVSQLHDIANVEFKAVGGIKNIEFNKDELTFSLPRITMNESTEVILRNLVAYEATRMKSSDILQFAEYVDLMCGIIDKPRDVELLRKRGIVKVKGRMEDEEIANVFNGIKRSTWDKKRKHGLDTALVKINERFVNSAQVKLYRFMKKHVYNSWKFLTFLATIVLLILTAFQSFCDVYGCSDHFFSK